MRSRSSRRAETRPDPVTTCADVRLFPSSRKTFVLLDIKERNNGDNWGGQEVDFRESPGRAPLLRGPEVSNTTRAVRRDHRLSAVRQAGQRPAAYTAPDARQGARSGPGTLSHTRHAGCHGFANVRHAICRRVVFAEPYVWSILTEIPLGIRRASPRRFGNDNDLPSGSNVHLLSP